MRCLATGNSVLDHVLEGGFELDVISTLYGPAGSGKTNITLLTAVQVLRQGKKVIFIDTEGGFSLTRLEQLWPEVKTKLDNIMLFKPTNFREQKQIFERLKPVANDHIGLIIVDSISMLYRLEIGKTEEVYNTNKELGVQLGVLMEITRKQNIPVLLTNQVYSSFEDKDKINMVGGDLLKYTSKCLIELQKYHNTTRKLILRKHRSIGEGKFCVFSIVQEGIQEVQAQKEKKEVLEPSKKEQPLEFKPAVQLE